MKFIRMNDIIDLQSVKMKKKMFILGILNFPFMM